jgi:F1F0 ATPase subunit 2
MSDIMGLVLAALGGLIIGAIYFAGLWWTLRKSLGADANAVLLPLSLFIRVAICLGGFYLIGAGDPARILACLAGFIAARFILLRLTRKMTLAFDAFSDKSGHAS